VRIEGVEAGCLAVDHWQGYLVEVLAKEGEDWLQYEGEKEPHLHATLWRVRVIRSMATTHGGTGPHRVGDEYVTECYYMQKVQAEVPDGPSLSCPWCQCRWRDQGEHRLWAECPDCKGN
jgi:hypothetical protein